MNSVFRRRRRLASAAWRSSPKSSQARRRGHRGRRRVRRRRRALIPDDAYVDGRRDDRRSVGRDVVVKVAPPSADEIGGSREGAVLVGFLAPLTTPETATRAGRRGGDGVRDGGDPADQPRAVDGRAVVAGQRRRLQGGAPRRRALDALLPDADDRGGHDPAGEGAGARRRRRRAAGAGDRAAPGRRRRPATTCGRRSPSRSQSLGA